MKEILDILYSHQDEKYGDFLSKLVPNLPREKFIGIRSPEYKKILKELQSLHCETVDAFLKELPHAYQEENVLHVVLINKEKDFEKCVSLLETFLPFVDNWAVSDVLGGKAFEKNHGKLLPYVKKWMTDDKPYTKRVAMLFLKKYFLDEDFSPELLESPASIRSDEYYVNMMTAWLFADALVKQWDSAILFLKENRLDKWTHNKTIQKARESFRITDEQKEYLKGLKR
ncbi:MAG: DNA alkylation repair protein [Treponemataceae bacterium]|nr:DNA alkylation repair protein [Treponemataceae bacterium]